MSDMNRWAKGLAAMHRSKQRGGAVTVTAKPRGRPAGTGRRAMVHEALAQALACLSKA